MESEITYYKFGKAIKFLFCAKSHLYTKRGNSKTMVHKTSLLGKQRCLIIVHHRKYSVHKLCNLISHVALLVGQRGYYHTIIVFDLE